MAERVAHDGIELNVEVAGPPDAPAVVFLHGVSGASGSYGFLPPAVTAGRRVLRVDLRGHGASSRAPGTYRLERHAADVVAVLRALLPGPAVLVGHSLGGCVAWRIAQRHPELVRAVFLEDPPLYLGEPAEHPVDTFVPVFEVMRANARTLQAEGADLDTAAARFAAAPLRPGLTQGEALLPDAIRARAAATLAMDPEVLSPAIDGTLLAAGDVEAPVSVPVALLAADEMPAFAPAHEARLARTHPAVAVTRVAGAGHGIHDEVAHRQTYVDALARFLDEHAG